MATQNTMQYSPYIEQRSEQLLSSVFGDPKAVQNAGESQADFDLRRFGRAGVGRDIPKFEVSGFSPDQLNAMKAARSGIGSYAPFTKAAAGTLGKGISALNLGLPITQAAANLTAAGTPLVQSGSAALTAADINKYLSPFQSYVTDEIIKQGDIATKKAGDAAQEYGAFGGSRHGMVEGTIAADTGARVGQANALGYSQALQAAENAKKRALYGGQGLGQLGQGLGSIGSRFGQFGTQFGQLGAAEAGLGLDVQRAGLTDTSSLMGIGSLNQQLAQAGLDAGRATEEARQLEPFTRMGFASDMLRGTPSSYTTYNQGAMQPTVSPFTQLAGLGIAGLGVYNKGTG